LLHKSKKYRNMVPERGLLAQAASFGAIIAQ